MSRVEITNHRSPLGNLTAAWHGDRLCALAFSEHWLPLRRRLERRFGTFDDAAHGDPGALQARLDAYFAGETGSMDDLEVDPGGTPFQRAVWTALRTVRPGETIAYGQLAAHIGAPAAVRAVGAANGANPIWLVIPCHRAIGADGRLTGYAGGLERKRWLLEHEAGARARPRCAPHTSG